DAEVDVPVLPPREVVHHGGDDGLAVAALGAEHSPAQGPQGALLPAGRVVDALDPLVDGDAREHERRADREDPELASLSWEALPEQEDQDERDRGDGGDEPAVIQHVEISPSTGRLR